MYSVRGRFVRWTAFLALLVAVFTINSSAATCNANPRLSSSFLEGYYPADWTSGQWDTLYTNLTNACITQIIIQYSAQSDPGNMVTYYPPGSAMVNLGFT